MLDAERYDDAAGAAGVGLAIDPSSTTLLAVLGLAHKNRGHLGKAETAFLSALRLAPDDPTLLSQYALVLAQGGADQKAERMIARAREIAPDNSVVMRTRIALAYLLGRDDDATGRSRELLEHAPLDPVAHSVLGSIASKRGSARQARRHFEEAARYELDDDMVEVALHARALAHPLMLPLWPLYRLGVVKTWLLGIGVFAILTAVELYVLASIWIFAYLLMVVYSWVAPPLISRWVFRGRR
jgi:Flp pilus assembly protein TadD